MGNTLSLKLLCARVPFCTFDLLEILHRDPQSIHQQVWIGVDKIVNLIQNCTDLFLDVLLQIGLDYFGNLVMESLQQRIPKPIGSRLSES